MAKIMSTPFLEMIQSGDAVFESDEQIAARVDEAWAKLLAAISDLGDTRELSFATMNATQAMDWVRKHMAAAEQ